MLARWWPYNAYDFREVLAQNALTLGPERGPLSAGGGAFWLAAYPLANHHRTVI